MPDAEQKRFSRAKNLAGREVPYAVLMYIWIDPVPVGTVIPSAHTSQVKMLAVASGAGGLGSWQKVQRNLADDYRRAYGAEALVARMILAEAAERSLDVLTLGPVVGPVVGQVSVAFDLFWNAPLSIPIGALTGRRGQAESLAVLREQLAAFAESQTGSAYVRNAPSTAACDLPGPFLADAVGHVLRLRAMLCIAEALH